MYEYIHTHPSSAYHLLPLYPSKTRIRNPSVICTVHTCGHFLSLSNRLEHLSIRPSIVHTGNTYVKVHTYFYTHTFLQYSLCFHRLVGTLGIFYSYSTVPDTAHCSKLHTIPHIERYTRVSYIHPSQPRYRTLG